MNMRYVLSVDQSTQGTKALLFDQAGRLLHRSDLTHQQVIDAHGWVSHDLEEIYQNLIRCVQAVVQQAGIRKSDIVCLGISNQRETAAAWNRETGKPICGAVVWQCSRSNAICERIATAASTKQIQRRTGIPLSPYFPASKFTWIRENVAEAALLAQQHALCLGTVDTWLIYRLTQGASYKTDYSNASRTQLFNISTLQWDPDICRMFGLEPAELATVCDSDSVFGFTDLEGFLPAPIPICGVLGDSHGALFGQGCLRSGELKVTYGTGSSVMMNIGSTPKYSMHGLVTSLAWRRNGQTQYVMEGNINYTGAVITWLQELGLIASPPESEQLARQAHAADTTYLVPAFTGLGAPYWDGEAQAALYGLTRQTGRAEIVKAGLESIAYQISDVLRTIEQDIGIPVREVLADGGATKNAYLMQFQSDISGTPDHVTDAEELSGIGAAYMAGLSFGIYDPSVFSIIQRTPYTPQMDDQTRLAKHAGWEDAVRRTLRRQA